MGGAAPSLSGRHGLTRVREFGPLIISIDIKGNNVIEQNKKVFNEKKKLILERIHKQVRFIS